MLLLEVEYPRCQPVFGSMADACHTAGVFNIHAEPMGDNIVIAWSNIVQAGVLHMASAWDLVTSDMTNTLLPAPPPPPILV